MNIRHGDLCLLSIKQLPAGLTAANTKVLMRGSGGNDHVFDKGTFYPANQGQFIFGYFVAKSTNLLHPGHGKKIKGKKLRVVSIPDGIYELRRQCEDTHDGMKAVID